MNNGLTSEQQQAVEAELFAGNKIGAIKICRDAIPSLGLKGAKEFVEALEGELRRKDPHKFKARPKTGCLGAVVVTILIVIAVATLAAVMLSR